MINKLTEWLTEQNKLFGTNGFAVNCRTCELLCKKTKLNTYFAIGSFEDNIKNITENNFIVVGNYNIIELDLTRNWERFKFFGDILPFGNMFPDDIYKIHYELSGEKEFCNLSPRQFYDEEWAWDLNFRQIKYKGIISNKEDPAKHPFWYALTRDQKNIIAKLHNNIKNTQIKAVYGKPIFKI